MNKILYLFVLVFLMACEDSDTPSPKSLFWEHSHASLMGLKGDVRRVVESTYLLDALPGEEENKIEYTFNASGRLTYYNPTGIEPATSTRWVGVASVVYSYQYDSFGRMVEALVTELGELPRSYTLTYGEHDCYVPLIFPVGPLPFFLVKGLVSIESSDGLVSYQFKENKASYSQSSWGGVTETVYEYEPGQPYPLSERIILTRNGDLLETTTTRYTFNADGALLSTVMDRVDGESNETLEHTTLHYRSGKFPQIASKTMVSGSDSFEWEHTYDSKDLPLGALCKINGIYADKEESYSFTSFDDRGNWIDSRQTLSSLIDWTHQDITLGVRREIE